MDWDRREVAERFGRNLKRARRRAGLSQEQAAARASLHRTEIGLLEHGGRMPRLDTIIRLAGAMEVEAGELVEGITWLPGMARQGAFYLASSSDEAKGRVGIKRS